MSNPVRVIDVQATEEKFRKMLKDAFGAERPLEEHDGGFHLGGAKPVHVTLHDRANHHVGSLDLPMEQVRFEFPDQSEEEADAFMAEYREHTMRTGG